MVVKVFEEGPIDQVSKYFSTILFANVLEFHSEGVEPIVFFNTRLSHRSRIIITSFTFVQLGVSLKIRSRKHTMFYKNSILIHKS